MATSESTTQQSVSGRRPTLLKANPFSDPDVFRNVFRDVDAPAPVTRPAPQPDLRSCQVTMGGDSYYDANGAVVPIPFLRLRGKWLDRAGFPIGVNLRITVEMGRLVIEPAPPELVTETVIVGRRKRIIE